MRSSASAPRDRPGRRTSSAAGAVPSLSCVLLLAAAFGVAAVAPAAPVDTLRIFFTAETRGNLAPCACPTDPSGGLARRVGFLQEAAARGGAAGGPTLLLDAGGFLPEGEVPLRDAPEVRSRYVRLLLRAILRAGIQATALDHGMRAYLRELAPAETSRLREVFLDADPPGAARVLPWGDRRVVILALEESLPDSAIIRAGVRARGRGDYLIVLARADAFTGRRLARLSLADLVILSRGARPAEPLVEGRSLLVGCGREGREVGEIRLVAPAGAAAAGATGAPRWTVAAYRLHPMDKRVPPDPVTEGAVSELLREAGAVTLAGARE